MRRRTFLNLGLGAALAHPRGVVSKADQLQDSYEFLVRPRGEGGALFEFSLANESGGKDRYLQPASFLDSAAYWALHVCAGSRERCAVHDTYSPGDHQLTPSLGEAGTLQIERVNAHNGANIYDIATWQIAVVLGASRGNLQSPERAYTLTQGLPQILRLGGLLHDVAAAPGAKRAVTVGNTFVYNATPILEGRRAYAFRALAPEWIARDPLMDSPYASWITSGNLPTSNAAYETGRITWSDWKPITGENAWAFLIGPLQAAFLHYVVQLRQPHVPFADLAVQNALDILPTFAAMQSALGGVYYAPSGTSGNAGAPVSPYEVSVENNLSLHAGLRIFRATLESMQAGGVALSDADRVRFDEALRLIGTMIAGGNLGSGRRTDGLLSFFRKAAWQDGGFVQGGLANDPAQSHAWVPSAGARAVDVQTWGIAALGAGQIDDWFGFGAAFEMWRRLKTWGAYGVGKDIRGVGYSDHDGNGVGPDGTYRQGVLSAEWTAGAINAVRNMIRAYGAYQSSSPRYAAAQAYVAALTQDERAMRIGLDSLRFDRYVAGDFPGKPRDYGRLLAGTTKPYLYASRRHQIPFGWYANPLPSTAATAWAVMISYGYDPFGIGGVPN